jgi:hypothetical protein
MSKQTKLVSDDAALRAFYEECGLTPKIIDEALKARFQEPTKACTRETDLAKRMRGKRTPPKNTLV